MEQLDLAGMTAAPDAAREANSPSAPPPATVDAPESLGNATPMGLRSSPPPLRPPTAASFGGGHSHAGSAGGSQSDSEAETVVLPGADGYSPSKIRKERNIKLEDREGDQSKSNDGNAVELRGGDNGVNVKQSALPADNTASLLGKRKRSKHGISRLDDNHAGNSSGLSSVPTSPVAHARSNLGKQLDTESDEYRSSSPTRPQPEKDTKKKRSTESTPDNDKDYRRTHRRRSSARDNSGVERTKDSRSKLPSEPATRRRRTHSPSPERQRDNRDKYPGHRSASSSAAHGLGNRKKSIPAPLRNINSNYSLDEESEDSSAVERTYPRRSTPRHQGTPPTAGSIQMMHRRKKNKYGRTPLAEATESGNFEKAKQLLVEFPEDLDVPDAAGNTPLQCAALNGHENIVELLIRYGCNIHTKNVDGDSPLLDAVENCHLPIVRLLLEAGVDPRARNRAGEEPSMKIDEEHEDADAIRKALIDARASYATQFRSAGAAQTPHQQAIESSNRRTVGQARANRTGQSLLYVRFDLPTLREAAAKGDLERVANILGVIASEGLDDPESTLAAAKGGHNEVLELLFALGNMNPDPDPVESASSWEYATPMLAAIGGDNTRVVQLLLQQAKERRFDPTKKYHGKRYFEIARERAGPVWEEEERLLKDAYDEYVTRSPAAARSNGSKSRVDDSKSARAKSSRREVRGGPDMSSPVRRGPGRPRKDNNDEDEQDSLPTTSRKEEEEQAKPRRKLVSGRELKDAAQEKTKSATSATPSPTRPDRSKAQAQESDVAAEKKLARQQIRNADPDTVGDQERAPRKDKSNDKLPTIRESSPAKRLRHTSPTPSEPREIGTKRRRLETDTTKKRRQSDVGHGSHEERRSSTVVQRERVKKDDSTTVKAPSQDKSSKPADSDVGRVALEPLPMDVDEVIPAAASPGKARSKTPTGDEGIQRLGEKRKTSEEIEAEVKSVMASAKRRLRQRQEAEEKAEAEHDVTARLAEDREKKRAEIQLRRENESKLAAMDTETAASEVAAVIKPGDIAGTREPREAAAHIALIREETAKRAAEEAEMRERQRREDSLARHREEDAKRAAHEEMQRQQREETERRQAARAAERARLKKEREATRLAKLPPLLRWFDGVENPAAPAIALNFIEMFGARYDTIRPEVTGDPNVDGTEQWILNTHVALLLGEKDLELTRYTGWERVPASLSAKHGYWRIEGDMYSMNNSGLDMHNPAFINRNPDHKYELMFQIRRESKPLFLELPLFFVKLSDFMFVVPKFPHLAGLKMIVNYHEALPDDSYINDWRKTQQKWKKDPGADINGWCPGPKTYVNGQLVHQVEPKKAEWSRKPNPGTAFRRQEAPTMPTPQQQPQQQPPKRRPDVMEVDGQVVAPSPPASSQTAPTNGNGNREKGDGMNGHFAGNFAGYSMHGATAASGPVSTNGGQTHPSLQTFRTLSPELPNGNGVLEQKP